MHNLRKWRLLAGIAVLALAAALWGTPGLAAPEAQVIQIKAKKYEYLPKEITVKKGVPVVLELTSLDRLHGFKCEELGIRADIPPKKITKVRFVPEKTGNFEFHCDVFCGSGHDQMTGMIHVVE